MAQFAIKILLLLAIQSLDFLASASATRDFKRRSDLVDVPPLSQSNYTVPLQGSSICFHSGDCTSSLPDPDGNSTLKFLTIARGVLTYDCTNVDPTDLPNYVSQVTQLYDVAALIPTLANEEALHQLVAEFYKFDFSTIDNSTIPCIGGIYTEQGRPLVVLNDISTFSIQVNVSIPPPIVNGEMSSAFNAYWAYSTSTDGAWEVYRVETVGGAAPVDCDGMNSTFEVGYAAEYWFYQP